MTAELPKLVSEKLCASSQPRCALTITRTMAAITHGDEHPPPRAVERRQLEVEVEGREHRQCHAAVGSQKGDDIRQCREIHVASKTARRRPQRHTRRLLIELGRTISSAPARSLSETHASRGHRSADRPAACPTARPAHIRNRPTPGPDEWRARCRPGRSADSIL